MVSKLSKSGQQQAFTDISRVFEERKHALRNFFDPQTGRFTGSSAKEIHKLLSEHLQEAENDACLGLLAAIEAAFRIDCDYCYCKRPKNERANAVRKMVVVKGIPIHRIELNILFKQLSEHGSVKSSIIHRLKQCFEFRHWLAHGRYWTFKSGIKPTFSEIYELAQAIDKLLYKYE